MSQSVLSLGLWRHFEEARHLKTPFRPDSFFHSHQTLTLSATLLPWWQLGMPVHVRWERRSRKVSGNKERFPVRTIPSFFKEPRGNLRALWPRSCSFLHSKSLHFPPQKWALAHPAPQDTFVSETSLHERCFLPVLPPAPRLRSWFLHLPEEPPHQTRCLGKPEFVLAACHSRCASASEKTKCQNE